MTIVDPILACLRNLPGIEWATPAGALRRGADMVSSVDVVAPLADPSSAFDAILRLPDISGTPHRGTHRLFLRIDDVQVTVHCPSPETVGAALLHLTGGTAHLDKLAEFASGRGWTLEPEGLNRDTDGVRIADTEEAIYEALGLQWIPPEIREGEDEIAMAVTGRLPALVSRDDIRGDFHMHTTWSDGRDSTEAMVEGCNFLGYEYLAITDHSERAAASRTLRADLVARQADEIAALRDRYPRIAILHGCEVDILESGALDFDDCVLERLDIVLASLHERLGHTAEQLLDRYVTAMRNPLVTLITHPTNRMIPYRSGYELDYDRLFEAAVETGTVLEIDGAPPHLDMNGPLARRAIAAGVTVAVDSDCHRAEMLDRQMELGVMTARRGWVEARHVLNTRPLSDVRALISAKRGH